MVQSFELVQESWKQVQPRATSAAAGFYGRLGALDGEAGLLLHGRDPDELARRMVRAIHARVHAPPVSGEAQAFADAWANPRFRPLGGALFGLLEETLAGSLTASIRAAWMEFFCRNAAELRAALLDDAGDAARLRSPGRYVSARG